MGGVGSTTVTHNERVAFMVTLAAREDLDPLHSSALRPPRGKDRVRPLLVLITRVPQPQHY